MQTACIQTKLPLLIDQLSWDMKLFDSRTLCHKNSRNVIMDFLKSENHQTDLDYSVCIEVKPVDHAIQELESWRLQKIHVCSPNH